jgi:YVTN family beta-propeller protein
MRLTSEVRRIEARSLWRLARMSRGVTVITVAALAMSAVMVGGAAPALAATTYTVSATIPVGSGPYLVGVDPTTHTVYVTEENIGTVSVIDGATNTVTATIPVGSVPDAVGVDPTTHTVYVTHLVPGAIVSVIDGTTNTVTATIPVGFDPEGVGVDPTTHTVYVANTESNTVSVITPSSGGSTPVGTNVPVVPAYAGGTSPVSMTFADVTAPGVTTLTTSTTAPALPGGFAIGSPATYYGLSTTASFSGSITVCISYAGITPTPTSLLHDDSGAWVNITTSVDASTSTICGTTSSLSPFALATLTFSYPASGAFVVGDQSATVGSTVTWSSPHWSAANSLSGGIAPTAFKGFAGTLSSTPPATGGTWSSLGGQGSSPPLTVPTYMAVIVTRAVTKSGSTISGTDARIAVVQVLPGYNPATGVAGTGTVLGFLP